MTASYTNQPGVRDIDTVRFEVDDRDCVPETDAALSDEEIQYLIDSNPHILYAAAAAAEAIGATYASEPSSKKVGDLQITFPGSGQRGTYSELADALRARAQRRGSGGNIYAGGISKTDKDTIQDNPDRVPLTATVGQHDTMLDSSQSEERGVMDF